MATINVPLVKLKRFVRSNHRLPSSHKEDELRLFTWYQNNKENPEVKDIIGEFVKEGN